MSGTPYQFGNPVTLTATFESGTTPEDLPTIEFRIRAPDNTITTYVFGVDANVTKLDIGIYQCALGAPAEAGQYHYEAVGLDSMGNPACTFPGEFYVIPSSVDVPVVAPGPILGPCRTWIAGEDLVALCGANADTDAQLLDAIAVSVSMLAYEASGRQFSGLCEQTVRPCADPQCGGWPYNWGAGIYPWWGYSYGAGWGWYGVPMGLGGRQFGPQCGCQPLSRVKLAGYPVREIVEVKINGDVLPVTYDSGAPQYRLDGWTWLTRMDDPSVAPTRAHWPGCQDAALNDDQPGTFSVTYQFGVDPPPLGILACEQLACEFFAAWSQSTCKLPERVVKLVRQGVSEDLIVPLAAQLRDGGTGIIAWDAFMLAYNPDGLRRRPAVYSPDTSQYAQRLGST